MVDARRVLTPMLSTIICIVNEEGKDVAQYTGNPTQDSMT